MLGGRGHVFSLPVAILMRLGVTIFKMPPSTAATVNQFSNPKVSDVERGGWGELRRAMGAICYSSLEWISPLLPSSPVVSQHLWHPFSFPQLSLKPLSLALPFPQPLSLCHILGPLQGIAMAQRKAVTSKCHPGETRAQPSFMFFHSTTRLPFSCVGEGVFLVFPHL